MLKYGHNDAYKEKLKLIHEIHELSYFTCECTPTVLHFEGHTYSSFIIIMSHLLRTTTYDRLKKEIKSESDSGPLAFGPMSKRPVTRAFFSDSILKIIIIKENYRCYGTLAK